jgi:hypothetical protein
MTRPGVSVVGGVVKVSTVITLAVMPILCGNDGCKKVTVLLNVVVKVMCYRVSTFYRQTPALTKIALYVNR